MKSLFVLIGLLRSVYSIEFKCCETCINETEKYYSIPKLQPNNCGESCLNPDDYQKYKRFEPELTKANTSHPCEENGFIYYMDTMIHGFGPIKVELDLYSNNETINYVN